jgi:hypothetical protein
VATIGLPAFMGASNIHPMGPWSTPLCNPSTSSPLPHCTSSYSHLCILWPWLGGPSKKPIFPSKLRKFSKNSKRIEIYFFFKDGIDGRLRNNKNEERKKKLFMRWNKSGAWGASKKKKPLEVEEKTF